MMVDSEGEDAGNEFQAPGADEPKVYQQLFSC